MQAAATPSRKNKQRDDHDEPEREFGSQVTADHFIASDNFDKSIDDDKAGIVFHCRGSNWIDGYAVSDKSVDETENAFIDFEGACKTVKSFYSDNSPELKAAARSRGWVHPKATPGRPETNGDAERTVRTVCEGARTALEHAGLAPKWWPYAMKHFCICLLYTSPSPRDS